MGTTIGSVGPDSTAPKLSGLAAEQQSKGALVVGLGIGADHLARRVNHCLDDAETLRLLAEAVAEGRVTGQDLRCLATNSRPAPATLKLA